jgi:molecular chaperone IbpA
MEGIDMTTFDFSPLFRSSVGFDSIPRLLDTAMQTADRSDAYPPYNIEKADDKHYRISIAVAGFSEDDLEITAKEDTLVVRGKAQEAEDSGTYLYRGIAGRAFERKFQLADHIRVVSADLTNGLLHINLEREIPEELKPRTIEIKTGGTKKLFNKAA